MCQSIATAEQPTHLDHTSIASATSLASEIKMTYQKMKIRDGPYHGIAIRAQERPYLCSAQRPNTGRTAPRLLLAAWAVSIAGHYLFAEPNAQWPLAFPFQYVATKQ